MSAAPTVTFHDLPTAEAKRTAHGVGTHAWQCTTCKHVATRVGTIHATLWCQCLQPNAEGTLMVITCKDGLATCFCRVGWPDRKSVV